MKHIYLLALLSLCINLKAQNFHMIEDMNKATDSYPTSINSNNYNYTFSKPFSVTNGLGYFVADDGIHGKELWMTDGSEDGTKLVKDITPGTASSSIWDIVECNDRLFFTILNSANSYDLWVSDKTDAGTYSIKNLDRIAGLTVLKNEVYFITNAELWKTDGTQQGTVMIANFNTEKYSWRNPIYIIGLKNSVFVCNFYGIWQFDEKYSGRLIMSDKYHYPRQLIEGPGESIFFVASDNENNISDQVLWVANLTTGETRIAPGMHDGYPSYTPMVAKDGILYFAGSSSKQNPASSALYKYDMTLKTGTKLIKNYTTFGQLDDISISGDDIYYIVGFLQGENASHNQLWKYQGSNQVVSLIKDSSHISALIGINNQLYFTEPSDQNHFSLWRSDGTPTGSVFIKDFSYHLHGGTGFCMLNGSIIFSALGIDRSIGMELWKTDGTTNGTVILKDINQTTTGSSYSACLTAYKNNLFFVDSNLSYIRNGTSIVKRLDKVAALSLNESDSMVVLNKQLFFFGIDRSTGKSGLMKSDGTNTGTVIIKEFPDNSREVKWISSGNNLIYFYTYNGQNNPSYLWRSDGTTDGTFIIKTNTEDLGYYSLNLVNRLTAGKYFYFIKYGSRGDQLWQTDGTAAGTKRVKNNFPDGNENARYLCELNGLLYFSARNGNSRALWKTNGTEEGTVIINDKVRNVTMLSRAGNKIFFSAYDEINSQQPGLAVSDGTESGTRIIFRNINIMESYVRQDVNGVFCFFADDGNSGTELWRSDGTEEGTYMLNDATPGPGPSTSLRQTIWNKTQATVAHGKLYLVINKKLWITDGTREGTHEVQDTNLANATIAGDFRAVGNQIYFSANTYQYGTELYTGTVDVPLLPLYIFNGTGDFDDPANWLNNQMPPQDVPGGVEVVIDPVGNGECILNVPLNLKGGKLTVKQGAKLFIR
ncbi:ELWxxDGT repeat protein [Foetidibacter luteolus]|uniref:ELWxxDGT repeat protein n=1 Tax=Foetidibacter luteolus TaxID=2608880 RepID=UPI00129B639D|nr:ELWxxDGT repeat protein [Foetidibacter luteolus]